MPQTFHEPQQPAPTAREFILTIPETQMAPGHAIELTQQSQVASKGQQQHSRGHPISFVVMDTNRLTFTLTLMNTSTLQQLHLLHEESQHESPAFMLILPADTPAPATSHSTTSTAQQEHQQSPAQSHPQPALQTAYTKLQPW